MTQEQLAIFILGNCPRVEVVRICYGFVANSYRWPCPRGAVEYRRHDCSVGTITYDAKRSHGRGPSLVGLSSRGGRLLSI